MKNIKNIIKNMSRILGYDIIKYTPNNNFTLRILQYLESNNISVVLDVGANEGFYAKELFDAGYKERIVSFEPLISAYNKLLNESKTNSKWQVAERCAIGDYNGKTKINISKNSLSSSVLPMLKSHIQAEPESEYIGSEEVNIYKLDTITVKYINESDKIYLKMDVQGYEDKIINGISDLFKQIMFIQLEMSIIPLYNSQLLFEEMLSKMKAIGYELYYLYPVFADEKIGRLLQLDGIFKKTNPDL
jgi:FkbM family methyltransferase